MIDINNISGDFIAKYRDNYRDNEEKSETLNLMREMQNSNLFSVDAASTRRK